ncbi:MAG: flagellin lysine-N-methylase [Clostridia bacterium]|nr:flagellin lysine-N-methylase [Clostridia bacterium]
MRVFKPSYYDGFECIADKCKHNCCIGWEIDVDPDTMIRYMTCPGELGDKLRENISLEGDCPHFVLGENERCPFLDDKNLCEIISHMGKDALCQICSDHPRFVSCIEDREEIGLGMCCEEAARLIVTNPRRVELVGEVSDEDAVIFNIRHMVFDALQNREKTIDERIVDVMKMFGIHLPQKKWDIEFLKLERLDKSWTGRVMSIRGHGHELKNDWSVPFEQILVYFIYRYMAEAVYDGRYNERVLLAILSFHMIREIFKRSEETVDELIEICRMYSAEVEYNEDNVEAILRALEN